MNMHTPIEAMSVVGKLPGQGQGGRCGMVHAVRVREGSEAEAGRVVVSWSLLQIAIKNAFCSLAGKTFLKNYSAGEGSHG